MVWLTDVENVVPILHVRCLRMDRPAGTKDT